MYFIVEQITQRLALKRVLQRLHFWYILIPSMSHKIALFRALETLSTIGRCPLFFLDVLNVFIGWKLQHSSVSTYRRRLLINSFWETILIVAQEPICGRVGISLSPAIVHFNPMRDGNENVTVLYNWKGSFSGPYLISQSVDYGTVFFRSLLLKQTWVKS